MSIRVKQPLKIIGLTVAFLFVRDCPAWSQAINPSARYLHVMTYDEQKKEILMYGGFGSGVFLSDLWALSNAGWRKLSDGGPVGRTKTAFVYDANRKVAVLFGGSGSNDELLGDTWEWNGQRWTERNIKGPSSRNHCMGRCMTERTKRFCCLVALILRGFSLTPGHLTVHPGSKSTAMVQKIAFHMVFFTTKRVRKLSCSHCL